MNIKHKVAILLAIIYLLITVPATVALLVKGVEWLEILKMLGASLGAFVVGAAFGLNVERLVDWLLS